MAKCSCGGECVKLIYTCSGAANTGYLADAAARKMAEQDFGGLSCLAGVSADMSGFIESAKAAAKNIVIDGCPVGCGKKIFEKRSLPFEQYITTDYGVEKGKTEISDGVIDRVAREIGNKTL